MNYTLYVNSTSPYSFKALAGLGYLGFPCEVARQNAVTRYAVIKRLTGKTMVPVLRRGEWAINDSSHILRYGAERMDRSIVPSPSGREAVAWLLEEFADEWVVRWFIYSRWAHREDTREASRSIGDELTGGTPVLGPALGRLSAALLRRSVARGGAREENRQALTQTRHRTVEALTSHLAGTDGYLFGGEPTAADFAFFGPLEQYRRDPTGGRRLEGYPRLQTYLDRLDRMRLPHPVVARRDEGRADLGSLQPLLAEFFGTYGRVLVENARARRGSGGPSTIRASLLDGTSFEMKASSYLVDRAAFVADRLETVVDHREALAEQGLEIGDAAREMAARLRAALEDE